MQTIHRDQLLNQLNWRYATKQFDPSRRISDEDWSALEESLVLSPSSYGLQPWKFIVVNDPAVREKLLPASWGQRQVVDASRFVVFAVRKDLSEKYVDSFVNRIAAVRGVTPASMSGYRNIMVENIIKGLSAAERENWAARQAYISLGNLLNSAALLSIDTCPMEGIEPAKYDEILGLSKQGLTAVVACALGYRAAADNYASAKKVRFPKQEVLVEI